MKNYFKDWDHLFIVHRPYLISFAFRMTGSLSEAEDIVQDTFLECAAIDPKDIQNHKSWLTKVASNKSLDHLKKAHHKRESYPGVWLPDSVPDSYQYWGNLEESASPDKNLLNSESLTTSFLLLLQQMSAEERVVYLLNEVFEYSFKEIGELLEKSEEATRKMAQRARKALESLSRYRHYDQSTADLVSKFFETMKYGDKEALLKMLASDSEFWGDGGGKVSVLSPEVVADVEKIAKFFSALGKAPIFHKPEFKSEMKVVNSRPGIVISKKTDEGWKYETILSFEVEKDKIVRIYAQRNPDKFLGL